MRTRLTEQTTARVIARLACMITAVSCILSLAGCATHTDGGGKSGTNLQPKVSNAELGAQALDEVISMMTGSFSSVAQAEADKDFRPIILHMASIWPEKSSSAERWLYVEQAVAQMPGKPYRQRVYRVTPMAYTISNGVQRIAIRSEVWELPGDPLRFAGAWQQPEPLADIGPESLAIKEGCEVVLTKGIGGSWHGSTVGVACPSALAGSSYATSIVEIKSDGLHTLDRGYDAKHAQVWGSEKGPYYFMRQP